MNDQNKPTEDGSESNSSLPPAQIAEPVHAPASEPATAQQLQAVEKQTSSFEKATLRWAKLAVFMSAIAALFVCLQWYEMHSGGQDTHDLAAAAGKQADAAGKQADAAGKEVDRMKDFADKMKEQADRTKELAEQAKVQAAAAQKSADIAHDALTRSNRPWVGVDSVHLTEPIGFIKAGDEKDPTYFVSGSFEITIKNYGSSPALSVKNFIEAYDPSMFTKQKFDPKDPFAPLRKFGDSTCAMLSNDRNEFSKKNPRAFGGAIFPTQTTVYTGGISGFAKERAKGAQWIQLVGCTVYRDQFGEKLHHTHYCFIAPIGKTGAVNNCESNSDAD
jgi:cell division protein FtsL